MIPGLDFLRTIPTKLMDRVKPMLPPPVVCTQPQPIEEMLPYETFLEVDGRTLLLLSDGSLGCVWELAPLPHEILGDGLLSGQVKAITRVLESVAEERATFQLIWDSTPSKDFALPDYATAPTTIAQKIMVKRIRAIQAKADDPQGGLACMRRRLYLTFRLQSPVRLGLDSRVNGLLGGQVTSTLDKQADLLTKAQEELTAHMRTIEDGITNAGLTWRRGDASLFLEITRTALHSYANLRDSVTNRMEINKEARLGDQIATDFLEMASWGIQLGNQETSDADTVQVLSWAQQPPNVYYGMLAYLLQIPEPVRVVVNLRPCIDMQDIDFKSQLLRKALDARGVRQLQEIQETQTRMTYGEKLMWVGFHVMIRNVGCTLANLREKNVARAIANQIQTKIGLPFIIENYSAPAIFFLCLPLAYRPDAGKFTMRERRVLSASLGPYLPLYGGFPGTPSRVQLMQNRAGDPIYLSPRDSETSPHLAILASSGGGKSFFLANHLTAEKAAFPDSLDFIIDNKTSYEILAKTFGEEGGYMLAKPPKTFPNIFLGQADDDRISIIVGILRTAISLASPTADLGAEHSMVLKLAVKKTFGANYIDAATEFSEGILVRKESSGKVVVPRLSDVCDKFTEVCREQDYTQEIAQWLRGKLSPYFGQGPYASIFDQYCVAESDPPTPAITLYDLDGVSGDPILCTLTTQICISEILRQVKRPENKGRIGRLVIEEAGVLGAKSVELVAFVVDAWKTFRKLGYSCIGLTNQVDDYRTKPAPKTMWEISPNKLILRMLQDEIDKACMEDREKGIPKLIPNEHYGNLVRTLQKRNGIYSQAFWWGDEVRGTFTYAPTGYDYWLAASKPCEVETVDKVAAQVGSYAKALGWLAHRAPFGFRDANARDVRGILDSELSSISHTEVP